ncbi:hypothetical protein ACFFKC_08065 [Pseudoduganella danionis]|uniref:Uncharacterized protein n=1 Tax=Pseudoduganella danionis TaxID=1890295 RepID=A0ABW9STR9_9BURK|nr:hypothetical protein [Pseudoduganella danionis]MTW34969.1 hypothetical protein [Pseudoduganella danionis]
MQTHILDSDSRKKDGKTYNNVFESTAVNCDDTQRRFVLKKNWVNQRTVNGVRVGEISTVATEEYFESKGSHTLPQPTSTSRNSPAAIAVAYACAVAESKITGKPIKYVDITKPREDARHLLCELSLARNPSREKNEVPIDFEEDTQRVFMHGSLMTDGRVTSDDVVIVIRSYYEDPYLTKLTISRRTGRASDSTQSASGLCRVMPVRRF